jgi:hypothetical protein
MNQAKRIDCFGANELSLILGFCSDSQRHEQKSETAPSHRLTISAAKMLIEIENWTL